MRVALVGPYPIRGVVEGGVEGVSAALAKGLSGVTDVDLQIITASSNSSRLARHNGVPVVIVPQSRRLRRLTFYRAERRRVTQSIRELDPDLVHVQGQNWYAIAALAAGYPTLVTLHGMAHKERLISDQRTNVLDAVSKRVRSFFNARFEVETLRRADHIVIISPYVRRCIESRTRARLYPLANPIDDAFFGVESSEIADRVLLVGFVEPRKAIDQALEVIRKLRGRRPNVRLHVAGAEVDKGYASALRAYVSKHGLQTNVRFCGHLDQPQLLREYGECCAVLLPSLEEASPLAIQQAMAAGKAVVATRAGGIPYLVEDGVTGFLADVSDIRGLAEALDSLLSNRELRNRMGARGNQRAKEEFRAEVVARGTLEIYRRVIQGNVAASAEGANVLTIGGSR